MDSNDLLLVILTPDSVREGITEALTNDLVGLLEAKVIHSQTIKLSKQDVINLYARLVNKWFFRAMVHNLTQGSSLLLVLRGDDLFSKIKDVKGTFRFESNKLIVTGLRSKYINKYNPSDLRRSGIKGNKLFYRMFEYRMHATDSQEQTMLQLNQLLNIDGATFLSE